MDTTIKPYDYKGHTYSDNHTQTLFCNCFAIVVLEVIVT